MPTPNWSAVCSDLDRSSILLHQNIQQLRRMTTLRCSPHVGKDAFMQAQRVDTHSPLVRTHVILMTSVRTHGRTQCPSQIGTCARKEVSMNARIHAHTRTLAHTEHFKCSKPSVQGRANTTSCHCHLPKDDQPAGSQSRSKPTKANNLFSTHTSLPNPPLLLLDNLLRLPPSDKLMLKEHTR